MPDILIKNLIICEDVMRIVLFAPPALWKSQHYSTNNLHQITTTFPHLLNSFYRECNCEWQSQAAQIWHKANDPMLIRGLNTQREMNDMITIKEIIKISYA